MTLTHLLPSTGDAGEDQLRVAVCYYLHTALQDPPSIGALYCLMSMKGLRQRPKVFEKSVYKLVEERIIRWADTSKLYMSESFREKMEGLKLNNRTNEQKAETTT